MTHVLVGADTPTGAGDIFATGGSLGVRYFFLEATLRPWAGIQLSGLVLVTKPEVTWFVGPGSERRRRLLLHRLRGRRSARLVRLLRDDQQGAPPQPRRRAEPLSSLLTVRPENRQRVSPHVRMLRGVNPTEHDRFYAAVKSRDARFDGRFFTAVKTTGIYCRPICPARPPLRKNVGFFSCAAAAPSQRRAPRRAQRRDPGWPARHRRPLPAPPLRQTPRHFAAVRGDARLRRARCVSGRRSDSSPRGGEAHRGGARTEVRGLAPMAGLRSHRFVDDVLRGESRWSFSSRILIPPSAGS